MRIARHVIFWILIWLWMTSVYLYDEGDLVSFLLFNLLRLPVIMAATYAILHIVVYKQLTATPPRYKVAAFSFLGIFLLATLLDRLISGLEWMEPTLNGMPLEYAFINPVPMAKNAFLLLSIFGLAASIGFFRATVLNQKQIFELKEEKLQSELAFLRSQVNPHFLFNTFNNLYSIAVRSGAKELAQGLSGMAGLMRYLTYESQVPKVPLSKEVNLIQSYIEIQQLRTGDDLDVFINFRIKNELGNSVIAPVILLPLVENAFKHGIAPGHPVWIDVQLEMRESKLIFEIRNKKVPLEHTESNGMGLSNLRKRLALIYPDKHELKILDQTELFTCTLEIVLP
ncbi:MAG TPA: histidine kinase [Cyclobacteriaceae bacterium]